VRSRQEEHTRLHPVARGSRKTCQQAAEKLHDSSSDPDDNEEMLVTRLGASTWR
jgi:hypothetical protein